MKIRRFNENTEQYLTIGDLDELFLYFTEVKESKILIEELYEISNMSFSNRIDDEELTKLNKDIKIQQCNIIMDKIDFDISGNLTMMEFKKFYDSYYQKLEDIEEFCAKKDYCFYLDKIDLNGGEISFRTYKLKNDLKKKPIQRPQVDTSGLRYTRRFWG